jgi:hypothetical protein
MSAAQKKQNKAHSATVNRLAQRFGVQPNRDDGADLRVQDMLIEVETTATLPDAVTRLSQLPGRIFVAVTNRDGVRDALRLTQGTRIGVMDPQGNIIRDSAPKPAPR